MNMLVFRIGRQVSSGPIPFHSGRWSIVALGSYLMGATHWEYLGSWGVRFKVFDYSPSSMQQAPNFYGQIQAEFNESMLSPNHAEKEIELCSEINPFLFLSPQLSSQRRRSWRKKHDLYFPCQESRSLGSMSDALSQLYRGEIVNIVSGLHNDNARIWSDAEREAGKHRVIFLKDAIIDSESQTYIEHEILITEADILHDSPTVDFAQRLFKNGKFQLIIHEVDFGKRINLNRPYIFTQLGDEIPGIGCPDLHCTFCDVRDWNSVLKCADSSGQDHNVTIILPRQEIQRNRHVIYDLDSDTTVGDDGMKPARGFSFSCGELFDASEEQNIKSEFPNDAYSSLPSKKCIDQVRMRPNRRRVRRPRRRFDSSLLVWVQGSEMEI